MGNAADEYIVPLTDQRYFGAGIRKERIQFIPALDNAAASTLPQATAQTGLTAARRYLSVVLDRPHEDGSQEPKSSSMASKIDQPEARPKIQICDTCHLPITRESSQDMHASSIAHQVCLNHAHPPSSLDRTRKGMAIMQSSGWDPDARLGLGVSGEGILHPIKPELKVDRLGIGHTKITAGSVRNDNKIRKLDAGNSRKLHASQRKRHAQLSRMFYGSDDVAKYLGED